MLTTHYLEEAEALCGRVAMLKSGHLVALERTSELLKTASSNVLRFKIDAALPPELADQARVTGRIAQLPAHDAREIEQHLATIRRAGLSVEDVEVRKADLEDVFLEVMARHGEPPLPDRPAGDGHPPRTASAADEAAAVEAGSP